MSLFLPPLALLLPPATVGVAGAATAAAAAMADAAAPMDGVDGPIAAAAAGWGTCFPWPPGLWMGAHRILMRTYRALRLTSAESWNLNESGFKSSEQIMRKEALM